MGWVTGHKRRKRKGGAGTANSVSVKGHWSKSSKKY